MANDINTTSGTCLSITASTVTLDGNGHSISGSKDAGSVGVYLINAVDIIIRFSNITNFERGIGYDTGDLKYARILYNNIYGNSYGIHIMNENDCNNNAIYDNRIFDNDVGIHIQDCLYNSIYNNFFDNSQNAFDNLNNNYYDVKSLGTNIIGGPYLGGNYWNDYTGQDTNRDGIGETSYSIPGGSSADNLPLVDTCYLTGLTNHTYGSSDTPVCSCIGGETVKLYRNGIDETIWNNTVITQEVGNFTWFCNATIYGYTIASTTVIQNISKTNQTITFGSLSGKTWGDADFAVSATATSGLTVSFAASGSCSISVSNVHITGAGSCTITASQSGNSNYNAAPDVFQSFTINKANATITVTPYSVAYNGVAHTATGTAKGVFNEDLSGLVLTGTTHTDAGDYPSDAWSFTDTTGNYNNASGTVHDIINKATSGVNLSLNSLDQDISIEAGSTANITAVLTSGGSDIYLYQNGSMINNGASPLNNTTEYDSLGTYNITVIYPGDENYTPSSKTHFITVQDTTPPQYSNAINPPNTSLYNASATYSFGITWTDKVNVNNVILQVDGTNYTPSKNEDAYSMTFPTCVIIPTSGGGGGGSRFYLMSMGPILPLLAIFSLLSLIVRKKKKYNVLSILLVALIINMFFSVASGADSQPCLSAGEHVYKWYANDTSNNVNSTDTSYFWILRIDPVNIYVTSPENITYSTSLVGAKYSIDSPFEISWIGYSLDNKPNTTLIGNTTLNIAEGSHNMIFYANTTYGVMNSSQRIYFTISLPKPDLTIGDIWTSGSTINYNIKNQGNANAGSSYSNLYVDDSYKVQDSISSFSVGSSNRIFSYSWTCSGTSDTIKVCADANNNVVESNENNNCLTKTFTCPVCTCTNWINTGNLCTGMVGGCYYKYVRTCANGCDTQSKCVYGGRYCAV